MKISFNNFHSQKKFANIRLIKVKSLHLYTHSSAFAHMLSENKYSNHMQMAQFVLPINIDTNYISNFLARNHG